MLYFLHGLNGYPSEWEPFQIFFEERGYSSTAVDFMKGRNLRRTRLLDYVDHICSMVTTDDAVIGHSMGGLLMLKVAEHIAFKAGVGICPAPPQGFKITSISPFKQLRYIPHLLLHIPFKPSYALYRSRFVRDLDHEAAISQYLHLQKQSSLVTYEVMKRKIPVDATKVNSPPLLIATKNDSLIPPSTVESMAQTYHADYELYPGNHYIFQSWEDIAKGILRFLKKQNVM